MPTFEVIVGKKVIPITARTKKDALKRAVQRVCPKDDKGELEATPSNVLQSEKELSRDILPELEDASKDSGVSYTFTTLKACMFFLRYDAMPQLVMCSDEDFIDTIIDFSEYVVDKYDGKQSPAYSRSALAKNPEKRVAFLTYWNTYYLEYFDPEGLEGRLDITTEDIEKKARVKVAKKEVRKTNRPDIPKLRTPSPEPTAKEIDRRREIRLEKERQEEFRQRLGEEEKKALEEVREEERKNIAVARDEERKKLAEARAGEQGDLGSEDAVLLNKLLGYFNVDGRPLIQKHKEYELETRTSKVINGRTYTYQGKNYFETFMFATDLKEMRAGGMGGTPRFNPVYRQVEDGSRGSYLGEVVEFMPRLNEERDREIEDKQARERKEYDEAAYFNTADGLLEDNKRARDELIRKLDTGIFQEEPLNKLIGVLNEEYDIIANIRKERGELPVLGLSGFIEDRLLPGVERPLTYEEGLDYRMPGVVDYILSNATREELRARREKGDDGVGAVEQLSSLEIEERERQRAKSPEPVAAEPVPEEVEDRSFFEGMASPSPAPRSPSPEPATPAAVPTPRKKVRLAKRKIKAGRATGEGTKRPAVAVKDIPQISSLTEEERKSAKKLNPILIKAKRGYSKLYPVVHKLSDNFTLTKDKLPAGGGRLFELYKNKFGSEDTKYSKTPLALLNLFALEEQLLGVYPDLDWSSVSENEAGKEASKNEFQYLDRTDRLGETMGAAKAARYKAAYAKLLEDTSAIDTTDDQFRAALADYDKEEYEFGFTPAFTKKYDIQQSPLGGFRGKGDAGYGDTRTFEEIQAQGARELKEQQKKQKAYEASLEGKEEALKEAKRQTVRRIKQIREAEAALETASKIKKPTKKQKKEIAEFTESLEENRQRVEDLSEDVKQLEKEIAPLRTAAIMKQRKAENASKKR
jgi:hypothetical protein